MGAEEMVRGALAGTGLDLVASCAIEVYDARAPEPLRSSALMPRARGLVVVGSSGRGLWSGLRAAVVDGRASWREEHPLDAYVSSLLAIADEALAAGRVRFRRFEATFEATPRLDFRALGELVGLGSMGPFGMLIHPLHGPWWATRAAYMVDAPVAQPLAQRAPCSGCAAPCVAPLGGSVAGPIALALATPEVRARCVVGQDSRYEDDQIAYHAGKARRA